MMKNIKLACWPILGISVLVAACSVAPPPAASDEVASTDSTDSVGTTDSTESFQTEEESTDDGEDSSDTETDASEPPPDLPPIDPNEDIPPPDVDGCPGIFAQDFFPTYELTIAPEVWELLVADWQNGPELDEQDEEYKPKRPLEAFAYGDVVIDDAVIRLRGNGTQWDLDGKMQFHVDFNEIDPDGRFLGQRHMAFDAAPANRHMLRDRLALWIMRDMGITATCANHARLVINDEYYGIFTSVEKLDKTFLERAFEDPSGDLFDRHNWEPQTNPDSVDLDRLDELKGADSISELEDYLDLEQALQVFAAEAILPDSDGMWAGGLNFFIYDDPLRGKFVLLPWDKDNTFDRFNGSVDYPDNPDPVAWEKVTSHGRPWYDLALEDDEWFDYYLAAIAEQYQSSYVADELHALIDEWTDQISDAVLEDPNKSFSNDTYFDEVEILHEFIDSRHEFLADWLECWMDDEEPCSY